MIRLISLIVLFGIFSLLLSFTSVHGQDTVKVFSPDDEPFGLTFQEHVKNFWKHIISLPIDENPWEDQTGQNCSIGQLDTNSSIFYLSGNGGGISDRTCKIPAGKGLFIPVSPMEISDKEAPNSSIQELHNIAKKDQDSVTSLYLKINDKEYQRQDLEKYRIVTSDFDVTFPKNPIFGVTEGSSKAVADGYYIMTEPLEKGNYNIIYKSSLICPTPDCAAPNFAQDVRYNLIVE